VFKLVFGALKALFG